MRLVVAQINCIVGDIEGNTKKIAKILRDFREEEDVVIVFPELIVSGYPPEDILFWKNARQRILNAIKTLLEVEVRGYAIIGTPFPYTWKWLNVALLIHGNQILNVWGKSLLPDYNVFYDSRYFHEYSPSCFSIDDLKIAVFICEDIWNSSLTLYPRNPVDVIREEKPHFIIVISASPFDIYHFEERVRMASEVVAATGVPLLYVNQVGAHTELVFDGGSFLMSPEGKIVDMFPFFEESIRLVEGRTTFTQASPPPIPERIYNALILGITDFFRKQGQKRAVVAVSGGVDSALVCCLASSSLGKENVIPLFMPSPYTSSASYEDVHLLMKNLGMEKQLLTIPIDEPYAKTLQVIEGKVPSEIELPMENLQARLRMAIAMYVANKNGSLLLNTSNKSEIATGYGTLYGDLSGALAVIGDLYKTQVYQVCHYINEKAGRDVIPASILKKAPSAELRPGQKDTDTLPPYEILDPILKSYIEEKLSMEEIISRGYEASLVSKVINMVAKNEFKRYQAPPVIRVNPQAWGKGWRLPVVGRFP